MNKAIWSDPIPENPNKIMRRNGLVHSLTRSLGGTLVSNFYHAQRAEVESWLKPGMVICGEAYGNAGQALPDSFSVHITRELPESEAFSKLLAEFWQPFFAQTSDRKEQA